MNPHQEIIEKTAAIHRLSPNLVMAIVKTESAFRADAIRYESHYKWICTPDKFNTALNISVETEQELQKFSYGLMQIMGAVAREHGFVGSMHKLLRPDIGLEYGCRHFAKYMNRYNNDVKKSIAAYNGGPGAVLKNGKFSNEIYVAKVMRRFTQGVS